MVDRHGINELDRGIPISHHQSLPPVELTVSLWNFESCSYSLSGQNSKRLDFDTNAGTSGRVKEYAERHTTYGYVTLTNFRLTVRTNLYSLYFKFSCRL